MSTGSYNFAAIQGIWGSNRYYMIQCPLRIAVKIFSFPDSEAPDILKELQSLDKSSIQSIYNRISSNKTDYFLEPLIAVTNYAGKFDRIVEDIPDIGVLNIPFNASFLVIAGQEQLGALQNLTQDGSLSFDDTVPVILIYDEKFSGASKLYLLLNEDNGNRSQRILVRKNDLNQLSLKLADSVPLFRGRIEKTRTTISNRSTALFTLSAVQQATKALLGVSDDDPISQEDEEKAFNFWNKAGQVIPEWRQLIAGNITSSELRKNYIHSHTVSLIAIGLAGNALFEYAATDWKQKLNSFSDIDWSRDNTQLWEGRAMIRGKMSKSNDSITLTVSALKTALGLPLTDKEKQLEEWLSSQ